MGKIGRYRRDIEHYVAATAAAVVVIVVGSSRVRGGGVGVYECNVCMFTYVCIVWVYVCLCVFFPSTLCTIRAIINGIGRV